MHVIAPLDVAQARQAVLRAAEQCLAKGGRPADLLEDDLSVA